MSAETIRRVRYEGKQTCCHSQAAITAFFGRVAPPLETFETLSSVPFGVVSVRDDPNRLLTSYLDPDVGLDRALDALGVVQEARFWPAGADPAEPLTVLRAWCRSGPVVIGPLNMDGLRYLFHPELYARCDHYLVVFATGDRGVWVSDTEGSPYEHLAWDVLADAWRGNRIPEGRGEFGMRRVRAVVATCDRERVRNRALEHAVDNLEEAARLPRGGARAFTSLRRDSSRLEADASCRRGLSFAISTRIQRCVLGRRFFRRLARRAERARRGAFLRVDALLELQVDLLSDVLADLMDRFPGGFERFERIGSLEQDLLVAARATRGNP